jgi:hypothetical protein
MLLCGTFFDLTDLFSTFGLLFLAQI